MSLRETAARVILTTRELLSLAWEDAILHVDAQLQGDVRLARAVQVRLATVGQAIGSGVRHLRGLWMRQGPSARISTALGKRYARPEARDHVSGRTLLLMAAAGICLVGISASFSGSLGLIATNVFGLGYMVCSCDHFAGLHQEAGAAGVVMFGLGSLLSLGCNGFGLRAALRSPAGWLNTFHRLRHGITGTIRCAAIVGCLVMAAARRVFRPVSFATSPAPAA